MSSRTFTYIFEELPLLVDLGFEAGLVNGSAEISYEANGEWSIGAIHLDGHKRLRWTLEEHVEASRTGKRLAAFENKAVALEVGSSLYQAIYSRLTHEWSDSVQDKVHEHNDDDRDARFGDIADRRHAERMSA